MPSCLNLTLPGLLCLTLGAQTPWPAILAENFGRLKPDEALMLVRPEDFAAFLGQGDDLLLRLRAERQLVLLTLPAKVVTEVWGARGWGTSSHWVLVNARGEEGGDGVAPPPGQAVADFLRGGGQKLRWEVREAFLKEHPGHGEAWMDAASAAFSLARFRLRVLREKGIVERLTGQGAHFMLFQPTYAFTSPVPELREAQADQVFEDWARALEGLRGVEGWLDRAAINESALLKVYGADASPRVRGVCRLVLKDLEADVRREPESVAAHSWWVFSFLAGNPPGQLPQDVLPLPGRPWPSLPFIAGGAGSFIEASDWNGALAFLSGVEVPAALPEAWEDTRMARAALALGKVMPLVMLGKEGEALAALEEARRWSGAEWRRNVDNGLAFPFLKDDPRLTERLRAALEASPLPTPPAPPTPAPLRLDLLGHPPWKEAWARLRHGEELLPWSPGELSWGSADEGLRAKQAWGPEPRWVLSRGAEILASGLTCPTAGTLANLLTAQGPSALQRLDALLERRPDHGPARRARVELLKARMPEPRLEQLLVEDELAVVHGDYAKPLPLDFGPEAAWKPDSPLWQWAATQALPRLQTRLEQWPSSPGLWLDWVAWSRFHPASPSPVALSRSLPLWGPRDQWVLMLPNEVHVAVGKALKARGDFTGVVDWLSEAWGVEAKTPAAEVPEESWNGYAMDALKDLGETVVKPLVEALTALGRSAEAREVERTFRIMSNRP